MEHIVFEMPVPHMHPVMEEIMAVQFIPHESIQESVVTQPGDIVVLLIKEEIVDVAQTAVEMGATSKDESGSTA